MEIPPVDRTVINTTLTRHEVIKNTFLFVDPGVIYHFFGDNVRIEVCQVVKDTEHNPLFREEFFADDPKRWEARYDNAYPNLIFDPRDRKWRLYWTVFVTDPVAVRTPIDQRPDTAYRAEDGRTVALCYAESDDGINWVKPDLGLFSFEGSTENNIIMPMAHGAGVSLDMDDPDPSKRYKMMMRTDWGPDNHMLTVAFSADGIHFSEPRRIAGFNPEADTHNFVFRDELTRQYVLITREWRDGLRICSISRSTDFMAWSEPQEMFRGLGPRNQIYSMPVFRYRNQYLGIPAIIHEGDMSAPDHDCVDTVLATAWNLDSWEFVSGFTPLIERGSGHYPDGAWDNACVYATTPVEVDDRIWFYWMGGNGKHTGFRETSFGRGYVEKDKFAHYTAIDPDRTATLALGPFNVTGEEVDLLVEVDEGGEVWFEVLRDRTREPVPGFGAEHCTPITESGWQRVRFDKSWLAAGPRAVIVLAHFRFARLYAIRGEMQPRRIGN